MFKYHIYTHKYKKHFGTSSRAEAEQVYQQLKLAGEHPILHATRVATLRPWEPKKI